VNSQIYEAHVVGSFDNDLIDKRDSLLDELSQYANINVSIDENEVANVSIGGVFAVDGLHHVKFDLKQSGEKLVLQTNGEEIKTNIQGGSLNALFSMFNTQLPDQINKLDELSITIMEKVNTIHSKGYTITDPPATGINFFTSYDDGVLEINQDILDDPFNIAISTDGTNGNNEIALEIAALRGEKILNGRTLADNYSDFVSGIANKIRLEEQNQESYGLVLHQLNQQKAEYSGVSTDEEMVNIVEYQKSYDAAAKLIRIADDLLETIMNMV
jgi:flagellar hook-associated protein 1 FlgK